MMETQFNIPQARHIGILSFTKLGLRAITYDLVKNVTFSFFFFSRSWKAVHYVSCLVTSFLKNQKKILDFFFFFFFFFTESCILLL